MRTPATTDRATAAALTLLKEGADTTTITTRTGLPPAAIAAAAHTAGHTQSHAHAHARHLSELLTWGQQHPTRSVQALAARATTALEQLATQRETEEARTTAQAEVEAARRALAAAEAKLRATGATVRSTTAAAPGRTRDARAARDRIRTWARDNGYQVGRTGQIAQTVLDAYASAHATTADRPAA